MTTAYIFRNVALLGRGYLMASRTLSNLGKGLVHRRTLAALEQLDDRMLRDIGLTRADLDRLRLR